LHGGIVTLLSLSAAFGISLLFQYTFAVQEHIATVFVFAVFLVSLFTEGYVFGIVAALVGTVAVNYAFTFPYFAVNFTLPVNLISGIVMVVLSVFTGALTTKLKRQDVIRAESEKERMRANLLRAVSHDLRTPLTTIYGSATTLLENSQSMSEQQKETILKGIKEDAEWLNRMVLKFKKRYPSQPIQPELPVEMVLIPMDALLIEQVLINILEIAVRAARYSAFRWKPRRYRMIRNKYKILLVEDEENIRNLVTTLLIMPPVGYFLKRKRYT